MILPGLAIVLAFAATWGLWAGYNELRVFRGTPFWDYRYIIFAVGAFLAFSVLQALFSWLKGKFGEGLEDH